MSNPLLGVRPAPLSASRPPTALPPALTYLLARIVADSDHRAELGRAPSTARLERLLHDTERALETGGLSADEVNAALRDIVEGLTYSCTTPETYAAIIDAATAVLANRTGSPTELPRQRRVG